MSRRTQLIVFVLLLATAAAVFWQSLSYQAATLPNDSSFKPADCWFEHSGLMRIECGYMITRTTKSSDASFELPVVVLRHSLWKNSKSPMLHIAGGPGGAAYLDADVMPFWIQNFIDQDWGVDFVLYDQRGTGRSKPRLDCQNSHAQRLESLKKPLTASEDAMHFSEQMQDCYEYLAAQNELSDHLGKISTDNSVDDIVDLHDLLGVDQWVLMGVSYGTRLALEVVRRQPEVVHSMVLDSVYPAEFDGFETLTENGLRAIQRLLVSCRAEEFCHAQFPTLSTQLYEALVALNRKPMSLVVPQTSPNKPTRSLLLTAHRLILLLDYASYDSQLLADVPVAISAVMERDLSNVSLLLLATNYLEIELFDEFSEPVYMITECKENGEFDVSKLMQYLEPYRQKFPMLDLSEKAVFDFSVCDRWKNLSTSANRDYRKPVKSDIPTLILAGALDSVTPPEWGRALAKELTNSRYLEYPDAAHSVLTSSLCSNDEVQLFLNPKQDKTAFCDIEERLRQRTTNSLMWTN